MATYPLDVVLNGPRNYIQGTQILARAAEIVAPEGPVHLQQAVFQSITDRAVSMQVLDGPGKPPAGAIGRAVFTTGAGQTVSACFLAAPEPARQEDRPPPCRWERVDAGGNHPLDADFALSGLHGGEDFLNALVQAVKEMHAALAGDVTDIWFTGLRRANIPMRNFPDASGRLRIAFDRMMARDGEFQSIQTLAFHGDTTAAAPLEAAITFAFKSVSYQNVP